MNEWSLALIYSAFQVTLLGSLAVGLYLFASRRSPAAAARVATLALGAFILLTVAATSPLPSWWTWTLLIGQPTPAPRSLPRADSETLIAPEEMPASFAPLEAKADAEGLELGWTLAHLRDTWNDLKRHRADAETPILRWTTLVPIVVLSGIGLGLLRLGLGLWGVHCYRRRSRPIDDPSLYDLLNLLRLTIDCQRPVEVRESPDLSMPATIGWRHPLILLPADWRTWRKDELQAVLAHELAHIRRCDYATALLARISLALHFYHPLAYWLVSRLQLQQELAADALGAACVGGRETYLRALAQLLLREDARPPRWPARAFLSPTGTLLRRIHMLRVKDGSAGRALPRSSGMLIAIVLAFATVGLSALRVPAQQPAKDILVQIEETNTGSTQQPASVEDLHKDAAEMAPFDLSYVSPDAEGILAVRPAAFLRRPGMESFAAFLKKDIVRDVCAVCKLKLPKDIVPPIESIEQVVLEESYSYEEKAPKGRRNHLDVTVGMIRSEKDFNWKKLLQTLVPGAEEVHYKGKTYCKGELNVFVRKFDLCYFIPDGRTVVLGSEKTMHHVLDRKAGRRDFAWSHEWQRVERSLLATALDVRRTREILKYPNDPIFAPLYDYASSVVCGVDLMKDTCSVQAFATCPDATAAKTLAQKTESWISADLASLEKEARDKPPKDEDQLASQFAIDLLKQARVTHRGAGGTLRMQAKINVEELVKGMMSKDGVKK
jgi:BlaR1 peptidase M56